MTLLLSIDYGRRRPPPPPPRFAGAERPPPPPPPPLLQPPRPPPPPHERPVEPPRSRTAGGLATRSPRSPRSPPRRSTALSGRSGRSDVAPPGDHVVRSRTPISSLAPTFTLRSGAVRESRTPCGIRTPGPMAVIARLFLNASAPPPPKPANTP